MFAAPKPTFFVISVFLSFWHLLAICSRKPGIIIFLTSLKLLSTFSAPYLETNVDHNIQFPSLGVSITLTLLLLSLFIVNSNPLIAASALLAVELFSSNCTSP